LLLTAGACTGDDTETATEDSATDSGTTDTTECGTCGDLTGSSVSDMDHNVLSKELELTLDDAAKVEVTCTLSEAPGRWRQLVTRGDTWRYHDDGSEPAGAWTELGYSDAGWAQGLAPLGYGDPVETELDLEATTEEGAITAYFRKVFTVDDPSVLSDLALSWRADDGVALTLNGTEVARDNLPAGDLTAGTEALAKISGSDEKAYQEVTLDPTLLATGDNVLAAEVHQYNHYSEDMVLEARLLAWEAPPATPPAEVHTWRSESCATTHTVGLHGLLPEATYACEAWPTCGGTTETFTVTTGSLPEEIPRLALRDGLSNDMQGTWTLFNHSEDCLDDWRNRLVIIDPEGQVRWYWEHPTLDQKSTVDIESELLEDGTILLGGGEREEGLPIQVDLGGDIVYESGWDGAEDAIYHHDVQWQDGQILGLIDVELSGDREGFGFVRHDPTTEEVTWYWDNVASDAAGTMPATTNPDNADDPYHANSIAGLTDDDGPAVYTTLLHANVILRIDETSGEMSWVLGPGGDFTLVDTAGRPLGDEGWFSGMHAIDVWGDELWVYDNGLSRDESRALIYTLDTANRVAELTWAWGEASWRETVWGDNDKLEGGNALVTMGHAWCKGGNEAHYGALVELDPATDEMVWRVDFLDPDDASYRGQRIDGCELFSTDRWCP